MSTIERASASGRAPREPAGALPRVLLDTNVLLLAARRRFPLVEEVERHLPGARIEVPTAVVAELARLVERGNRFAPVAMAIATRFPRRRSGVRGDESILRSARTVGAWVVTADRAFVARLRSAGVAVLVPRGMQRLEVVRESRTTSRSPRAAPSRGNSYERRPGRGTTLPRGRR